MLFLIKIAFFIAFLSKICYNQNINHPIHQTILSYFGIIHQRRIKRMDNSNFFNEGYVLLDGIRSPLNCVHINVKNQSHLAVAHYHEYIELLYGIDCNMNLLSETKSYNIKSGDFAIVFPNEVHSLLALQPDNNYYAVIFSPELLYWENKQNPFEQKYIHAFMKQSDKKRIFTAEDLKKSDIPQNIEKIIDEWKNKDYGFEISIHSKILDIFLWLIREWKKVDDSDDNNISLPDNLSESIHKACKYIQLNYNTVTASEISKMYGYSYSYFLKAFKKHVGASFSEYVSELKVQNAAGLLLSTPDSVTDIAMKTGFSTISHFIAEFKKQYKITPLKFRKNAEMGLNANNWTIPSHVRNNIK